MLGWGVADFFAAKAVRKSSILKTFFWAQTTGMIVIFIIFSLFFRFPVVSFSSIIMLLISALLGVISLLAFYKGLQIGTISIVSPVASAWAVIVVLLSMVFLDEALTALQTAGISLAIIGGILASFRYHDLIRLKLRKIARGVEYGLIAMLGWGIMFTLIGILVSKLGWFFPMMFINVLGVLYVLTYSSIAKKNVSFPKNVALVIVLAGILQAIAFLAFGAGVNSEYVAIVAPVAASFPAVTIILARIFFKEILELNQKIGIISVLVGFVLLSI